MTEKCVIFLIYLQIKRKGQRLLDYIMNALMGKVILMGFEGNLKERILNIRKKYVMMRMFMPDGKAG